MWTAQQTKHLKIVLSDYSQVKLIRLNEKTDPGTARNIGIDKAKGDLIAFIDSDCIAAEGWLEKIHDAHQGSYRVVGGSVRVGDGKVGLIAWAGYIAEFREYLPQGEKREVAHIPTCNISYKRSIFDIYGCFNGRFYPQEDLVFNYMLSQKGEKLLFDPGITVFHHHRETFNEFMTHQKKIGLATSLVLKKIPLAGASIARNKIRAIFWLPFLPCVKFVRTVIVFAKLKPSIFVKHPLSFLVFAFGLIFWSFGFLMGVFMVEKSE